MAVLSEFRVPAGEFVLADTLTALPDTRIEIKRVVATEDSITPYFWAIGENLAEFEALLHDDPNTGGILTLEEDDADERFFRVNWRWKSPNILTAVSESKATILDAANDETGGWELKVLFPSREELASYRDYCLENDITYELERIYQPENTTERGEYEITQDQQEALEAAYDRGYFNVPRDNTLTDIAEDLEISRNALSTRLRRGHRNLLRNTIIHEE